MRGYARKFLLLHGGYGKDKSKKIKRGDLNKNELENVSPVRYNKSKKEKREN